MDKILETVIDVSITIIYNNLQLARRNFILKICAANPQDDKICLAHSNFFSQQHSSRLLAQSCAGFGIGLSYCHPIKIALVSSIYNLQKLIQRGKTMFSVRLCLTNVKRGDLPRTKLRNSAGFTGHYFVYQRAFGKGRQKWRSAMDLSLSNKHLFVLAFKLEMQYWNSKKLSKSISLASFEQKLLQGFSCPGGLSLAKISAKRQATCFCSNGI